MVLVKLEHPHLCAEPHGAEEGLLVVEDLLQKLLPGDGLVLEDPLQHQGQLSDGHSLDQLLQIEGKILIAVGGLHHVDCYSDQIDVLNFGVVIQNLLSNRKG